MIFIVGMGGRLLTRAVLLGDFSCGLAGGCLSAIGENELGSAVVPVRMDVTNESDIAEAVDLAIRRFGRLDCLFNNAGSAGVLGPIDETPFPSCSALLFWVSSMQRGP
jgi:NAD(P)-dependent dehydrogenase (short-subunit alcohol dehydrogenase family)